VTRKLELLFYFRSTDSLFKVHLRPITKKVILWSSLEDILTRILTVILTNIQHHHRKDQDALLYFCIAQTPLVSGIRSSVHVLAQNSISSIVENFLSDFHRFVSSNAEMKLNDTFELYLHVASGLKSRPTNRRKAVPIRSMVGHEDLDGRRFKGSLINLPCGYPANPNCFKDCCALASLTYKSLELRNPKAFEQLKPLLLSRSTNEQKNKAGKILFEEMAFAANKIGIPMNGPHDLEALVRAHSTHFEFQVIVILSVIGNQVQTLSSPTKFNMALPRIYLFLKRMDNALDHVLVIDSISTFFKTHQRAICFFCEKLHSTGFSTTKKSRHKCKSSSCCKKCFGFLLKSDTFKQANEPWQFCDSELNTRDIYKTCSKCGFVFSTEVCFLNHQLYCGCNQYFWSCPVCQKSISMMGKNPQVIEETHRCDIQLKYCRVCLSVLPLDHVCSISKTQKDKEWPNIGVVTLAYENGVNGLCQVCYEIRHKHMKDNCLTYAQLLSSDLFSMLACPNHLDKLTHVANIIKVYYETERFQFRSRTFSTKNFLASSEENDEINFAYCESPMPRTGRKRKLELNQIANPVSVAEQFLSFLLASNLSNYVFLVQTNAEMLTMLELFLQYYQPFVIQNGRNIKKMDINELGVSFILFENYCQGDLFSLLQQFDICRKVAYFPESFNNETYHKKVIPKPNFSWFLSFNDDERAKQRKQSYYSELPNNFNVNQQLNKCISQNLKSFLLVVLYFLRLCFDLEDVLCTLTKTVTGSPPIHPFKKVMSLSGFSIALCKLFYLNRHHISSVSKPYNGYCSQVSSKEYEYVSFLAYTRPEENIKHAFNSTYGQKTFGNLPVDAYGENSLTVYQFHSCELHGHTVPNCTNRSVMAKGSNVKSKNCYGKLIGDIHKREEQDKAILFSKFGHLVKKYDIMWECTFQEFKRSNKPAMDEFWLRSGLPRLRPLSRLVPRASVRGGFLEVYRLMFEVDDQYDLHYFDMNAQYSFVALKAQLPLGPYKIFLEHELKDKLTIKNNQFFVDGESCIGDIAHVTFWAPSDLMMPFLPIRIGENCFYANCYSCLVQANCKPCRHQSPEKRKFSSTYTVLELQKALELNYQIVIHEL